MDSFYDSLNLNSLTSLTDADKALCDSPIQLKDVADATDHLKLNKSPDNDGLTAEFYKKFANLITPFLHNVYLESLSNGVLPASMTQSIITLIPKPQKDHLHLENWRPISLLNNDYKILASILARRIKSVLDYIIDECQYGFIKGRVISNNIRLVLDLIDYPHLITEDSFLLFLDFYKAFDTTL